MENARTIRTVIRSRPTMEGAGVHLRRVFGNSEAPQFDPFLLLDDFRSGNPDHYRAGFPWHPHRGIETITYVLTGDVEHGDSMGNKGVISSGDMQWMTAGSGIIHQEMPQGDARGRMEGFQLWANLPRSHKMMEPRYRDIKSAQVPEVALENGVTDQGHLRQGRGARRPGQGDRHRPRVSRCDGSRKYRIQALNQARPHRVRLCHRRAGGILMKQKHPVGNGMLCLYADGDHVAVTADQEPVRFLLISGKPIGEPIAWYGPIVMNTNEELQHAFDEYRNGTFIKHEKPSGI